jgi:3-oxoisoapionate decarboxylase
MNRVPLALCAYSLPHTLRYLPDRNGNWCEGSFTLNSLVELAAAQGLQGVEFPLETNTPVFDGKTVETAGFTGDLPAVLSHHSLTLIADYGVLLDHPAEHNIAYLNLAASMGARTVRAILSHILCGDRRGIAGGWREHLNACAARLREILPVAESLGIRLCIENHQDLTSAELLWLHEASGGSAALRVTLDTGNPLAVAEDPVAFAAAIAPIIGHVHMKDYRLHFAPGGYHLVRCAAGDGVVDFVGILDALSPYSSGILPAVEVAAQATRTIPVLDTEWWSTFDAGQISHLPEALGTVWSKGIAASEPYKSLWEQGKHTELVAEDEMTTVLRSIQYLKGLMEQRASG